ncbi:MAG: DUF4358 domain-containing protein [Ruminococcus sp.]|nr:DUF4358 domain-containing protein [Ruminococcus sp.]
MKKKLIAVIAALTVCVTGLASCGGSDSSSAADGGAAVAESTAPDKTYDVIAVADSLKSGVKWVDSLNELESDMVEKVIGVKAALYTKGKVYIGSGGTTAEEIACFEATDNAAAGEIVTALNARVEAQKKAFENYQPAEMTKLGAPVIVQNGKYVFMCISDENDKAKEIIG